MSRSLDELHPKVKELCLALMEKCEAQGIQLLITSTYRDAKTQQELYNQGRKTPGKIVTNAKPGKSWHNWRRAFDVVPLINGKPAWDDIKLWKKVGKIGVEVGLEWAGNWKTFKEYPHFQYTQGLSLADMERESQKPVG